MSDIRTSFYFRRPYFLRGTYGAPFRFFNSGTVTGQPRFESLWSWLYGKSMRELLVCASKEPQILSELVHIFRLSVVPEVRPADLRIGYI
ncbi:hypothetical protein DPMN_137301 [Dreissena polymorpha]|uniref:Uncharacterized protein n=1 Tax=Dreissena polymorpha TaxID=45954 RepID=A0A9D4JGB2_DREPO|nr:hypothetical protein DPMN_137301 [Dreissena polymorpha]